MQRSLLLLENCINSEETRKQYLYYLSRFISHYSLKDCDSILAVEQKKLVVMIEDYVIHLKKQISPNTLPTYLFALKSFLEINDVNLNWKRIKRLYPAKVKLSGLKYMCQALTSNKKIEYEKRPAIIVLDGENSFTEFTPKEKMYPEVQEFLTQHEIGNVDLQVLTLSDNVERSDSTLSLREVTYKDMMYLIPELESKTENIMLQALRLAFHIIQITPDLDFTIDNLRNVAIAQARNSGLIHPSQIPALARALHCDELDMFNQPNKTEISPELLLQPGKITVLNVHNLDKNRRRVVALYVQQILNRFKMETANKYPGAIFVVDEAELLFPNKPTKRERDYVDRIAERMEDVTNRGRKRFYGLFIVSHLPSEVSPKVVALANTKMAFRCSGASNHWISSAFGREYVDEINDLPIGTCRIKVNISTVEQKPINAKLYMPNVEEVAQDERL